MHFHRAYPLALVFGLHALIVIACLGIYTPRPPDAAPEIMATLLDPMPAPEAAPVTEHPKPTPRPSVQREIRPVAAPTTQLTPPTAAPTPIPKPLPAEPVVTAPSAPIDPMPVAKAPAPAPEPVVPPREDAQGLHNSAPIYPSLSRQLGEQGRVTLSLLVQTDGSVADVKLEQSSGYARLDHTALEAARHWHFISARQGNQAIAYRYTQVVVFSLDR